MANPIQVAALSSAIKQHESGGNYDAQGKSGEVGAYQIMPGNYPSWASAAGQSPTDTSPQAQDAIASNKVSSYLDKYNGDPTAVALAWNGGSGAADQYAQSGQVPNIQGTNTSGANYNVQNYVSSVLPKYQSNLANMMFTGFNDKVDAARSKLGMSDTQILDQLGSVDPIVAQSITQARAQNPNDSDIVNQISQKWTGKMPTVPSVPDPSQQGGILSDVGNFFNNAAKGAVTPVVRTLMGPIESAKALVDYAAGGGSQDAINKATADLGPQNIPWLGSVTPVGAAAGTNIPEWLKDTIGTGLQVGSLAGGGEGALEEGATREAVPFLSRVAEGATSGAKIGGFGGAAQGAGSALQAPNSSVGSVLAGTAEGGLSGAAMGGALGGLIGGALKNSAVDTPIAEGEGPSGATPASMAAVSDNYSKAIQPSMAGMTRPGAMDAANAARQTLIHEIVGNAKDLGIDPSKLTTEQMPDVAQALLDKHFQTYDSLQKAAGLGVDNTIDLNPIANQVEAEAQQMKSSPLLRLKTAGTNAQNFAESLRAKGSMSLEEAQQSMKDMNAAFKTYKMASDPIMVSQGAAERKLYNYLGDELGSKVENATGVDYGGERKAYAQIKSLMPELQRAANKAEAGGNAARQTLLDHLMDGEILVSAAHGNVPGAAGGLGIKLLKGVLNNRNLPDAVLQRMLAEVERSAGDSLPTISERASTGIEAAIKNALTRRGEPIGLPAGERIFAGEPGTEAAMETRARAAGLGSKVADQNKTPLQEIVASKVKFNSAEEALQNPEIQARWNKIIEQRSSGKVTKTSNNLYHTTSPDNLESIRENGLTTGNKARFAGVSSPNKISFSANEAGASYYGKEGDVLLRTKASFKPKDLSEDLLAGGKGTYTTSQNISPDNLEVKVKGKWRPLSTKKPT